MSVQPPVHADVPYGPHERNRLDVWPANTARPAPLTVVIHGGGWKGGDKRETLTADWAASQVQKLMAADIAVASINYRYLSPDHPLPAPLDDAARAIQFLRGRAAAWNIDPRRVAALGGSAGACSTLWLAFHPDQADPASLDPVARESTRLTCAAVVNAQCSIYPAQLRDWAGPMAEQHGMIATAFGHESVEESYAAGHERDYLHYSPYTHMDKSACPVFLANLNGDMTVPGRDISHAIHHPSFSVKVKQAMDALGRECWLDIQGHAEGRNEAYADYADFLIDHLAR